jgi:fructose-1-phosphate kinase PfkB-like protein
MKLCTLLKELQAHQDKWEYQAFVIKLTKGSLEDPLEFAEFPVLEIDVENEAKEITLVSNERSTESTDKPTLNVHDLALRLSELETECSDYHIFSGSAPIGLGDDYYGRVDTPIYSTGWNDDDRHFGILQAPTKSVTKRWWQFWK